MEMIATSLPQGRIVKIVNVYTVYPFCPSLQLQHETAIALVPSAMKGEGRAWCLCPQANSSWETGSASSIKITQEIREKFPK